MDNLNELRQTVEQLAFQAGEIALSFQGDTSSVDYKDGYQESPVTAADLAVDAFLKTKLTALNPSWGWLSEETADDGNWRGKDKFWIVDPIDGTTGFVHFLEKGMSSIEAKNERRQFSVSIALVGADGLPILGVVYTPMDGRMMSAAAGFGCFCATVKNAQKWPKNGKNMEKIDQLCSKNPEKLTNDGQFGSKMVNLGQFTYLASTSEMRRGLIDFLVPELNLKTVGSSANKIALVATSDDLVSASVKPKCWWDVAAAACLMTERGYKLTDLQGCDLIFKGEVCDVNGIIAAPLAVYDALYDLLPRDVTAGYV